MANLYPCIKFHALDNNGNALSGGKVYAYASGTSTAKDTYSTADGSAINANPVILDTSGQADIYLSAGDYKIVLKDANDYTIDTIDPVRGEINASDVNYTASGTGAVLTTVETKLRERLSVKDFGATGDGSTNDTDAIQAAIDATAPNGVLEFPVGNYLMGAITISDPIHLNGQYASITLTGGSAIGFQIDTSIDNFSMRGLKIIGDGVINNGHKGIFHPSSVIISNAHVIDCEFTGCVQSIDLAKSVNSTVERCKISKSAGSEAGRGYGVVCGGSQGMTVSNCRFEDNGRHAVYCRSGFDLSIVNNVFAKHAKTNSSTRTVINIVGTQGFIVEGNTFRNNEGAYDISVDDDTDGTTNGENGVISNNLFFNESGAFGGIDLGASSVAEGEQVRNILIDGNKCSISPAKNNGFIVITNGFDITISNNLAMQTSGTANDFNFISLSTGAGKDHFGNITIENNSGVLQTSGDAARLLGIGPALTADDATNKILIFNNTLEVDDQADLIQYIQTDPPKNPNIRTDWDYRKPITISSSRFSCAGYNNFELSAASQSTITHFDNGHSEKQINLFFKDSNITINRTSCFLSGSANFISSNHDVLILRQIPTAAQWEEITRSVNG